MFNGDTLRDAIISAANNLTNNRKQIDDLNVFPVPDGDTGTNMSMTLANSARELEKLAGVSAGKVASVNASALLRGARGNSGVITSLLFRGFAKGLDGAEYATAENIAAAFALGVEAAYKAVMKPTEGTILTVARIASEYAAAALNEGKDALGVFEAAIEGAKKALAETPELLPTLKKAGVVDAGGKGFVTILEGMLSVFKGGVIIRSEATAEAEPASDSGSVNAAGEYETEITFTYCTEFIVNRDPECEKEPHELRAYLESIGDCVVVVDDEEIIKSLVIKAIDGAAERLVETRIAEGERLKTDLIKKLDGMVLNVQFITEKSPIIVEEYKEKITTRVHELLEETQIDEARIAQEVTMFADKVCVDEELVRLDSHIKAMKEALINGGTIGRRLDFIAQEMNREANTTLSKTSDQEISDKAIELKTDIEKVREQIQNIE